MKRLSFWVTLIFSILLGGPDSAARTTDDILNAVVRVRAEVPSDARTAGSLGTEREGNGVVVDSNGLVLTIGYLILEASRVEVTTLGGQMVRAKLVGYDHQTGFGLIQATESLGVAPLEFGISSEVRERDRVLVVGHGGSDAVQAAVVVSRREYAGYWEYLLENAIYTAPPFSLFGGAALIGPDGSLLGIGSVFVQDALIGPQPIPGNVFVPIDLLKPILSDMKRLGRSSAPAKPWLGVSSQELQGRLIVIRVRPGTPGDKVGIKPGDLILGVGGEPVQGLADFYRKVWSRGNAGAEIPLNVLQGMQVRELVVQSSDRYEYLKLQFESQRKR